jgi:hypothetical protein
MIIIISVLIHIYIILARILHSGPSGPRGPTGRGIASRHSFPIALAESSALVSSAKSVEAQSKD